MTIKTPDSEPLVLSRAWIEAIDGGLVPLAEIDGRVCYIETKPTLLEIGIASCVPRDGRSDDWPHTVEIETDGEARPIWDATTDARVVAAARRWATLSEAGDATVGTPLI